jgi:hypothetical protein
MTRNKHRRVRLSLAVAMLLFVGLAATGYPAHAASPASTGRMSAAASNGASSSTPCNFKLSLKTCESTDPNISYTSHAYGNTSQCTFVFKINWGDGQSTTKTETDPPDGNSLIGEHTYVAQQAYTIGVKISTTAGTCTAKSSVHTFTLLDNATPNYAGYSFNQPGGYVKGIAANWTVPAVTCPATGQPGHDGTPRAAVWAGLWGETSTLDTDWLPQIGTNSQCDGGTAYYMGDVEMETGVHGGGGWLYRLGIHVTLGSRPWCFTNPSSIPSGLYSYWHCGVGIFAPFSVTAGDQIEAEVDYLGTDTSKPNAGDRIFKFILRNKTRSEVESFKIETTIPVKLQNIIYQGGGILEDHNSYGGLAKFGPASLQFPHISGTKSGAFDISPWLMWVYGTQLVATGPVGARPFYPFKMTFNCNGCLGGGSCPPNPPCTKY